MNSYLKETVHVSDSLDGVLLKGKVFHDLQDVWQVVHWVEVVKVRGFNECRHQLVEFVVAVMVAPPHHHRP